jgi:hypothetical protein
MQRQIFKAGKSLGQFASGPEVGYSHDRALLSKESGGRSTPAKSAEPEHCYWPVLIQSCHHLPS